MMLPRLPMVLALSFRLAGCSAPTEPGAGPRCLRPRAAWDGFVQDLRYALRGLRRAPAFTVTALLAIAVGTGAATAVFSVVDHILFRPLPYADAGRLVSFGISAPIVDDGEFMLGADYYEWRDEHSWCGRATSRPSGRRG